MNLDKIKEIEESILKSKSSGKDKPLIRVKAKDEIPKITESNKIYSYQKIKKNKIYGYLKNTLYIVLFCLLAYLGTSNNSDVARHEGEKTKNGVHK